MQQAYQKMKSNTHQLNSSQNEYTAIGHHFTTFLPPICVVGYCTENKNYGTNILSFSLAPTMHS